MRSKPPFRSEKTHVMYLNVVKLLRPVFGNRRLSDITPAIEGYLKNRLNSGKSIRTKLGIQYRGQVKPMTVRQEFCVLKRVLNVAVKQKRLVTNLCSAVEFPVPVSNATRKP